MELEGEEDEGDGEGGEEDEGDGEGEEGGEEDEGEEGGEEDEGWLMDFVYFPSNHSSAWVVWNARHRFHITVVIILLVNLLSYYSYYSCYHIIIFQLLSYYYSCNVRDLSRVATVQLPQRVPYGVHGLWLDKHFFNSKQSVSQIN